MSKTYRYPLCRTGPGQPLCVKEFQFSMRVSIQAFHECNRLGAHNGQMPLRLQLFTPVTQPRTGDCACCYLFPLFHSALPSNLHFPTPAKTVEGARFLKRWIIIPTRYQLPKGWRNAQSQNNPLPSSHLFLASFSKCAFVLPFCKKRVSFFFM